MVTIKETMFVNPPLVQGLLDKMLKKQETETKRLTKIRRRKSYIKNKIVMPKQDRTSKTISRAAIVDQKERRYNRKRKKAIEASPDLNKLQAVVIHPKLTIYVSLEANPIEARNNFIKKYQ